MPNTITTKDGTQIYYKDWGAGRAPHGLCSTHKDQVNADLLAFLKS